MAADEAIDVKFQEVSPHGRPLPRLAAAPPPPEKYTGPVCSICWAPAPDVRYWIRMNLWRRRREVPMCPSCATIGSQLGSLLGLLREELAKQGVFAGIPRSKR